MATAKVIINNVKGEIKFRKKKGQYYIQTWHAGFSPKLLELDAKDTLPKDYLLESENNSKDKPILAYTIDIFESHPEIDNIEVVCHRCWKEYLKEMINKYDFKKVKWITDGGDTFQDSVISGVENLKDKISLDDYVLVQYGAAPFTSEKIVSDVIRVMKEKESAVSATPCYQLIGSKEGEVSKNWVDRDLYTQIACPYGFKYSYLLNVYERAEADGLIDKIEPHTTSLMYALGDEINLAYGDQTNIKITTKEDFDLFEGYVLMKMRRSRD